MDSDIKSPKRDTFSKVMDSGQGPLCGVCLAPASHKKYYGGVTCVSCRMFFRRSVNRTYECVRSTDDCKIDAKLRKFCKKCRFRRCLENEMDPKRVRSDQKTKTNEEIVIEVIDENELSQNCNQQNVPLNPQEQKKLINSQQSLSNSDVYLIPSPLDDNVSSSSTSLSSLSPFTASTFPIQGKVSLQASSSSTFSPSPIQLSASLNPYLPMQDNFFSTSCTSLTLSPSPMQSTPSPMSGISSISSVGSVEEVQRADDQVLEEILEPSIQEYILDSGGSNLIEVIESNNMPCQTAQRQQTQVITKKSTAALLEVSMSKLSLDEEYLIHEIVERKNLFGEWYYSYIMRHEADWYKKVYSNDASICEVGIYNDQFFKALYEMDNFMIPEHFGVFRREFLVSLTKFTVDALNFFDAAVFLSNDRATTILEQDLSPNISPTSTDLVEKFSSCMEGFGQLPPRKAEDFSMFKSPWCKSQEDEIFFETTFDELGQIGISDDKVKSLINLLILFTQSKNSPYGKLRNIKRLKKDISSLLYRYLKSVTSNHSVANDLCEKIIKLVNDLERCVHIYYNCRLK